MAQRLRKARVETTVARVDMSEEPNQLLKRVGAAAAEWNALLDAMFPDLMRSMTDAGNEVARVREFLAARPRIDVATLRSRLSDPDAADAMAAAIEELEAHLGNLQIEIETLSFQARRTLDAGNRMVDVLTPLSGVEPPAPVRPEPAVDPDSEALRRENAALNARVSELTGQMACLETQVQTPVQAPAADAEASARAQKLEAELRRVATAEAQARAEQREAQGAAQRLQGELAALRLEVATLKETNERLSRPLPGSAQERFEWIAGQAFDEEGRRKQLGRILLDAGVIRPEQLEIALGEQQSSWRRHIGVILVDLGFATEENIAQALAAQLALPYVDLRRENISNAALALIARPMALLHTCVPLGIVSSGLRVAMANPLDLVAVDDLRLAAGRAITPVVATASQIRQAISDHYLM